MAHAQKPDFVFRRNGRQFSRLLAAEVCASAVVMLDTPCSEVVWRVLATHSIRQIPLHFPSRASPCAIRFQLDLLCVFTVRIYYSRHPKGPQLKLSSSTLSSDHIFTSWPDCVQTTSSSPDPNYSRPRLHILTQLSPDYTSLPDHNSGNSLTSPSIISALLQLSLSS